MELQQYQIFTQFLLIGAYCEIYLWNQVSDYRSLVMRVLIRQMAKDHRCMDSPQTWHAVSDLLYPICREMSEHLAYSFNALCFVQEQPRLLIQIHT